MTALSQELTFISKKSQVEDAMIAKEVENFMNLCTVATKVESVPQIAHKALKIKFDKPIKLVGNFNIVVPMISRSELHILKNSSKSYMVLVYASSISGEVFLLGKYNSGSVGIIKIINNN